MHSFTAHDPDSDIPLDGLFVPICANPMFVPPDQSAHDRPALGILSDRLNLAGRNGLQLIRPN
jgi:hypothetical protein